ncbi:hypothetical protein BMS3Bbin02_00982 [bacterium BMS3Bbin02]|nr:hypothetical protein BMS3Bbin02_00982 [bacterium BMS3Bbin02]
MLVLLNSSRRLLMRSVRFPDPIVLAVSLPGNETRLRDVALLGLCARGVGPRVRKQRSSRRRRSDSRKQPSLRAWSENPKATELVTLPFSQATELARLPSATLPMAVVGKVRGWTTSDGILRKSMLRRLWVLGIRRK